MKKKKALITGISGQDGAYLAKLLLSKNYKVYGGDRRTASGSLWRLEKLKISNKVEIIDFELAEDTNIHDVIMKGKFDEVYNLGAQSFVKSSFDTPLMTSNINAFGTLRILDAIRYYSKKTKFYQASTSEMYGGHNDNKFQNEDSNFKPRSPYAISKLYSHWITAMYREAYDIFCCSGILFNHESPIRGHEFVTKKIVSGLCKIKYEGGKALEVGNIYSKRDWGFAGDYVEAMWKMLQQKKPDDYVVATGETHTIKDFIKIVGKYLGFDLIWTGKGLNEKCYDRNTKKLIIKINKKYFRPAEVDYLRGDYSKAKKQLKWKPRTSFEKLVEIMCEDEINSYK
jgi:GDPmannose 4,6-dehydratase